MKALDKIAAGVVVAVFIGLVIVFSLLFWPVMTIEFTRTPVPIDKEEVLAGEYVQLDVDYCKYTDLEATVTRELVDTVVVYYEPVKHHAAVGCHNAKFNVKIPDYMASGVYFLRTHVTYHVNPLRDITVTHETEKFKVRGLVDKLPEVIETR